LTRQGKIREMERVGERGNPRREYNSEKRAQESASYRIASHRIVGFVGRLGGRNPLWGFGRHKTPGLGLTRSYLCVFCGESCPQLRGQSLPGLRHLSHLCHPSHLCVLCGEPCPQLRGQSLPGLSHLSHLCVLCGEPCPQLRGQSLPGLRHLVPVVQLGAQTRLACGHQSPVRYRAVSNPVRISRR